MNARAHHGIPPRVGPAPVVAGIDGSATAVRAAQWAAVAAGARNVPLQLVHVVRRRALLSRDSEILAEARRAVGDRWAQTSHTPAPEVTELTLHGDPAAGLIGLSTTASEVVVGSVGHSSAAHVLLGSVASAVASAAHSPVTIVRPLRCAAAAIGPVLVVVEPAGPGAAGALTAAMRSARERATDVVVVELTRPGPRASSATGEDVEGLVADLRLRFPSVRTSVLSYFGPARTALERFGSTAQLVVVPRDHRTLWPPLHSMARAALWHTRCAVSIIPDPTASPTGLDRFLRYAPGEVADWVLARTGRRIVHTKNTEPGETT